MHDSCSLFQREILLNVLKLAQSQGHLGGAGAAPQLHNRGGGLSPHPPDTLALLQQRLSPGLLGVGGGGGLAVVSPTHNQRIPSPQELQAHTQQVTVLLSVAILNGPIWDSIQGFSLG